MASSRRCEWPRSSDYTCTMRLLRAGLAISFVVALIAAFYRIYFVPPIGWTEWALLTVGISMLGGLAIGTRSAIRTAFMANVFLSLFLLAVGATSNAHIGIGTSFLLVQVLVSTGATAAALRLRGSVAVVSPAPPRCSRPPVPLRVVRRRRPRSESSSDTARSRPAVSSARQGSRLRASRADRTPEPEELSQTQRHRGRPRRDCRIRLCVLL